MSIEWTDAAIAKLRELHAAGYSAAEIALQLGAGATRNAVIGKVNRLGLAGETKSSITRKARQAEAEAAEAAEPPVPARSGASAATAALQPRDCRWPHGDPQEPDFHYCCASAPPGQPYCAKHARAAVSTGPGMTTEEWKALQREHQAKRRAA